MSDESIDGHVTVSHHLPTLWGLFYKAEAIGSVVIFALPGGLVFWLIAFLGRKQTLPPHAHPGF